MASKYVSRAVVLSGVMALGMGASASHGASLMSYSLGSGSSVSALSADPGLVVHTQTVIPSNVLNPNGFSLNDGESYTFNFFNIWTDEADVNPDDLVQRTITATLDFDSPVDTGISIGGQTRGKMVITGTLQSGGHVSWNGPAEYVGLDGLDFRVTLSDADFNLGPFLRIGQTTPGQAYGATIQATIYQVSSPDGAAGGPPAPTAVPTPAASMGGGMLVAALGAWRRFRRAK